MNPYPLNNAIAIDKFLTHSATLNFFLRKIFFQQDLIFNDDNGMLTR